MAEVQDLTAMLGELLAMPGEERDFVLEILGPEGEQMLLPRLQQLGRQEPSPALASLIAASAFDEAPEALTPRAAAALRRANSQVRELTQSAKGNQYEASRGRYLGRMLHWLGWAS